MALLQRYKEVSAEAGVTSNNISVIDRAEPPLLPISPNPKVNITFRFSPACLALATVAALETFHDGSAIRTKSSSASAFRCSA